MFNESVDDNNKSKNHLLKEIAELRKSITEGKLTEKLIRESEIKYRASFDNSRDPVNVFSKDKKLLDVNKKMIQLSGYSKEELTSMNLAQLYPEAANPTTEKRLSQLLQGKEVPIFETKLRTKNGVLIPVEIGVTLIKLCYNDKYVFQGNVRDITKRQQMEAFIRQAEKMEAIGQLAGGIAHDFNNQLGVVMGNADLMREKVSSIPALTRYADNIISGIKRASDLTEKLLAFARKGKYLSVPVNIHSVILEVISLLKHSIDKNIIIKQKLDAPFATVMGDPTQLQNSFLNLGLNSRDAMPDGGELIYTTKNITFDEKTSSILPNDINSGKYIQIDVKDYGNGIDDDTSKHIFEPFFTTKAQGQGTGMGLAAVYGSMKNHNGAIRLNRKHKNGTEFNIFLPLIDDNIKTSEIESTNELKATNFFATTKESLRIFVIDDEKMICDMALDMLENLGYKVNICTDGYKAIKYYKENWEDIDLVILDMIMPEICGKEAFYAMQKINSKIKVILSSGYSINNEVRNLLEEGALGFIHKPFMKTELAQIIVRTCEN